MAKIIIYEDALSDILEYSSLADNHEVHAFYLGRSQDWSDAYLESKFKGTGFDVENLHHDDEEKRSVKRRMLGLESPLTPLEESADVYFLDGLKGYCFELIKNLPIEKAFINTSDPDLKRETKEKGFNVVDSETVEEIVERIIRSS